MPTYTAPPEVLKAWERVHSERDNALAECEELGKRMAAKDREHSELQAQLSDALTLISSQELKIATLEECLAYFRDTLAALQAEANLTGAIANAETARLGVQREAG